MFIIPSQQLTNSFSQTKIQLIASPDSGHAETPPNYKGNIVFSLQPSDSLRANMKYITPFATLLINSQVDPKLSEIAKSDH